MLFCPISRDIKWVVGALMVVVVLSACAPTLVPEQQPVVIATAVAQTQPAPHQIDAKAQAVLAFTQFRMYGAHDRWDEALASLLRAVATDPDSEYLKLLLARVYLHLEHPDVAIGILTELLENAPASFDAHLLLGDVYLLQQQNSYALDHFNKALALNSEDESLHLRLAMVYLQRDQVDVALATLERFLQKQPDAHQATLSLARIYRDSAQPDAAQKAYRHYLESFPAEQLVIIELGRMLEQQDQDAALKLYHQSLIFDPYATVVRQQLVQLYLARQQPDEALLQLLILRKQFPKIEDARQIGLLYLHLKRWSEAQKEFQSLLASEQATDKDHYYLALALIAQQRHGDAIAQLEQMTSETDVYHDAMLQLAYLHQQQNDFERAFSVLEGLLDRSYQSPEVYYYLIAFHHEHNNLQQALELAVSANARYPENIRLLYQSGLLYHAMDEQQRAYEIMERILNLDHDHADALNYIAYSQAESETDLPLALKRAKRALELKPAGYIEDTVGWIYFKLGRYQEGRKHLERANLLQPEDQVILEHLGDLLRAMKRYEEAAAAYRRVLDLDPAATEAADKLDKLHLDGKL